MSVEIDDTFSANCAMHNWKQPEDKSCLTHCPGCRMIQYCGEACRKEHKNHCRFLADPTKCPVSLQDAETCSICRPAAGTGKGKRRMAGRDKKRNQASSSYECITKDIHLAPSLSSPHPFPVASLGNDLLEKSIIVMQHLVHKLKQNPRVAMACSAELEERNVTDKVIQGKSGKDAFELWKIILLVHAIVTIIGTYRQQDALKNPIESMPEQYRNLVKLASDKKFEILDIAEEILDSLSTQVIPYEDIVKKLCGGKKKQNCSFCGVKVEVTEYFAVGPYDKKCSYVLFGALFLRKFSCVSQDCRTKASSTRGDMFKLSLAVATACIERKEVCCDYCFQLCPIDEAHRCRNCLTVMYCSKSCYKEDKEKHSKRYCFEDERKTKHDSSMRRQMGEMTPGRIAAITAGSGIDNREAILNEALEAFQFGNCKSKKRAGDAPNTERDHNTSIPEGATVHTAEDDRSKSGTGDDPVAEHTNDCNVKITDFCFVKMSGYCNFHIST